MLSSWRCHPHCDGVAFADKQASLQSRHLCHCCNNVVALIAMALLPLTSWCCCPCHNSVIAIVNAQAFLLLSQWHCCPCCTGAIANIAQVMLPLLHQHCILIVLTSLPSRCMGIVNVVAPALLPPSSWHVCAIVLVLLPLPCWHCCPWCTGIITLVAQASLP